MQRAASVIDSVRDRFALPIGIIAGALMPLAFEPFGLWFIAPLCLCALFFVLERATPRQAFTRALWFGVAGFLGGTYWTFISVSVFYGAPALLGLAAMLGLVLVLALFFAIVVSVAARFVPLHGPVGALGTLPALWVVGEWCRSWMFSGFGWLAVGYSHSDTWLMSLAPMLGLHGVSYAVALSAGVAHTLIFAHARARKAALMLLVAMWGIAWVFTGWRWTAPRPELVNVAIVQAAIEQDRKWQPEQYEPTLATYRDLSMQVPGRDLIVWPEVAVPNLYEYARGYLQSVQGELAADGATLVTGVLRRGNDGAQLNAVVAMTPEPQFYEKRHLVPFGEYLPLPEFALSWLREFQVPFPDIGAGQRQQPLLRVAGEQLAVSICYEDVFGAEQRSFFPEATLVINVANDAWFGNSIAAEQHLQIARVRAAEVDRYVLRATNTGVSAIIDPLGNVVQRGPSFEPAVLSATVQGFSGATPYVRLGNVPIIGWLLALLAAVAITVRRRG